MAKRDVTVAVPSPLVIDDSFVTVPVRRPVQVAIEEWAQAHVDSLREALEPFGLAPEDIRQPDYERVIWTSEVTVQQNRSE